MTTPIAQLFSDDSNTRGSARKHMRIRTRRTAAKLRSHACSGTVVLIILQSFREAHVFPTQLISFLDTLLRSFEKS